MFWIHGGGYSAGSSQELPSYDGESLSKKGDVVVVQTNKKDKNKKNANQLLFIYGPNGSGKTRLLRAMAEELNSKGSVILTGAESLVDEMIDPMHTFDLKSFRSKYLQVDSLLIDNLWVLKSRPTATAELCRLFRDRNKAKRITVVASEFSLEEWCTKNRNLAKLLENGGSLQCSSVNKMRISSEVLNE